MPLFEYVDGPPRPGMVSYPFMIQLPERLTPSMYLASKLPNLYRGPFREMNSDDDDVLKFAHLSITYLLRAQVVPIHAKDWMDEKCTISTLNG